MNPETASDRDRVGPYQLVKAIGAGGSARIDLARIDRAYGFQRHVVIKRPLEHLRGDTKAALSLVREARIGARLRHPNLVAILDAGVHDGYNYLVLEYVHGGSLRTLMQAEIPQRVRDTQLNVALAIVGDVARGLHDAHELVDEHGAQLGLVHRDVSPGNILLGLDGSVKLADFGIAKETRVQTLSGSMHGTVTYMAPEQCRGHAFDRRADVFSLGVILYELVTGARLFWADNDVASLHRVLSGNVPRPRKLRPQITPALEEIVMTAVAHEQERRFASTRDLADALELHAQDAGEILGARWIARWVHEVIGPRENPWIDAPTAAEGPEDRDSEGSLVAIIEQLLEEEELPVPTFGPTNPSFSDEIDTKPDRRVRSNKGLVAVIAAGLITGVGATAFVMTRGEEPRTETKATTPIESKPPSVEPAPVESKADEPVDEQDVVDPEDVEMEPTKQRDPTRKRIRRGRARGSASVIKSAEGSAKPTIVEAPEKAGSNASTRPMVEWSDKMLLPTDTGSGTKKK